MNKPIPLILNSNLTSISNSISASLNTNGTLISKVHFTLQIDLISLIDQCPEAQAFLTDLPSLTALLHSALKEVLTASLSSYTIHPCISELMSLEIALSSAPCLSPTWAAPAALSSGLLRAMAVSTGRSVKSLTESYKCMNPSCPSVTAMFREGELVYAVDVNTRCINRISPEKLRCSTCSSVVDRMESRVRYEYNYVLNLYDEDEFGGLEYRGYVLARSGLEWRNTPGMVSTVGYMVRNERGGMIYECLRISSSVKARVVDYERYIAVPNEEKHIAVDHKLSERSHVIDYERCHTIDRNLAVDHNKTSTNQQNKLMPLQKRLDCLVKCLLGHESLLWSDIATAVIANIFNTAPHGTRRIQILTNDTNRVVSIIRAVAGVPVIYSEREFLKAPSAFPRCIFVTEKPGRRIKQFMDLGFQVMHEGSGEDIELYDYTRVKPVGVRRRVRLDGRLAKEVFAKEREVFKGVVEPERLLNTVEGLYLSLKGLTGEDESVFLIPGYFNEFILTN